MSKRQPGKANKPQPDAGSKTAWKVVITTATRVSIWDGWDKRYDTVFTSGTEGIVSAKLAKEGNVLAVAGSQVVLLHKIEKGQQQSYKLKGSDATRLLEYAADGKSIFLNSSIRNAIQTYNVRDDKIAGSLKPHPSPVTCFAASLDSSLILSASQTPPTIHIDNLSLRTTTHLKPRASDSKVILSAFHPTRKNVFLVAFADGVLAAYEYSKASRNGGHIHAFGHLHDAMMGGNGITAAEFVPGSQTKAVTAGEDGRCLILDFDKKDVIGSFHVGAPVACLSIRSDEGGKKGGGKWLATVGTVHGWCFVYDQDGNRLHEVQVDSEGNKVLEVRWKFGDVKLPATPTLTTTTVAPTPLVSSPRKTSSSLPVPTGRTPKVPRIQRTLPEEPIVPAEKPDAPLQFPESPKVPRFKPINANKPLPKPPPTPKRPEEDAWEDVSDGFKEQKPAWEDLQNNYTADYMSIFSPVKNEPLKNSPRRSSRLSVRSAQSPKGGEDRIASLIKQDEEGLLRPSASSPSLATISKPKSPAKKNAPAHPDSQPAVAGSLKPKPSKKEKEGIKATKPTVVKPTVVKPTAVKPAVTPRAQEVKRQVPVKDGPRPEPPVSKDFVVQPAPSLLSVPSTDSKAVEEFRKVRAKFESGHSQPVLSLFSSHMPNHKTKQQPASADSAEGKENSTGVPATSKPDTKAEKKKGKLEEKERRRSAREEKKRKKRESNFPSVSELVFNDDDMDIDIQPVPPPLAPGISHGHLELPSLSSKTSSTKRKATDDHHIAPSPGNFSRHLPRLAKGKEKARTPVPEDIWVPDEVRKPAKRVNFGEGVSAARAGSQPPLHDGTMSIHDMIADLKTVFKYEVSALKADMEDKLDRQSQLFEGLINNERSEVRSLRADNERLKAEIEELIRFGGGV
ncbi:hypothetical protein DRE_07319 [Drechslerella stenobrocha 248]|uniref:WD40 repeat-like protein n=1 Tax=Drechslerella stenobrocha 248 TaxID=1043628 RepID=W7I4Y7_9PEZI|nr:hypothetical protein DRE_07319 [Drechslerella stenobrocha 248]